MYNGEIKINNDKEMPIFKTNHTEDPVEVTSIVHKGVKNKPIFGKREYKNSVMYLLDLGATCHVTNDKIGLTEIKNDKAKIIVGENMFCNATISGSLTLF